MPTLVIDGGPEGLHYRLHYRPHAASQPDASPPLLLVHGAGGNLMHWPGELRRLPGHTVVALDLPGHGHSGGATQPQDIGAYAQVIERFANGLRLPGFVLAGHSMGGAIAQEFALHHPQMLAGLVLVATGAKLPVPLELLSAIQGDWENAARVLTCWSQGASTGPDMSRIYLQRLRELDPQVLHRDYAACKAWDRTGDVGQIRVPTLVICGDADRMTPLQSSLLLDQKIKTSQLVVVPGAGHMVMLERPALVARAVQHFLTELERGT
jgi:pimeloyl-ACP methyl ester carboxylesterase